MAIKQLELDLQDPQRSERGTALLPRILWTDSQPTEDFAGSNMSRSQFLDKALPLLTALEQVSRQLLPQELAPSAAVTLKISCGSPVLEPYCLPLQPVYRR